MTDLIKKLIVLSSILFISCNNMIDGVNKSDTQKINTVKYGTLVAAEKATVVMMACHSSNCTRLNMLFRVVLLAYWAALMRATALLASSEAPSFCK